MTYDLHLHSCLSPCADDTMTPATIAGFAALNGIELIAIADHNSALNLPAAQTACDAYGIRLLPAIEATTQEEIHLLMYFNQLDSALEMGEALYASLPDFPYNREIWGCQMVVDEHDQLISEPQKLLTSATGLDIYQACRLCKQLGGIPVPAHVDKDTTSLLSVLGFAPDDLPFAAYEVKRPEHTLKNLLETGRLLPEPEILTSSDAHTLGDIPEHPRILPPDSVIRQLL